VDRFRVVELDRRQHYKDRNPPWIKLHSERLEDPHFASLPDNTKAHLLLIELLASRTGNALPLEERFIRARINARSRVNLSLLLEQGFIERIASAPLASCEQDATPETEQRRDKGEQRRGDPFAPDGAVGVTATTLHHENNDNGNGATTETALAETWPASWCEEAATDWTDRFDGPANIGRIGKALVGLRPLHPWTSVRSAWKRALRDADDYFTPERFVQRFGVYAGTVPPLADPRPAARARHAAAEAAIRGGLREPPGVARLPPAGVVVVDDERRQKLLAQAQALMSGERS
jgi:hypothetical protein